MPLPIEILLLAILGAAAGSLVNWAIYQWAVCQHRPVSPWMKPRPELLRDPADREKLSQLEPRSAADFVPILGWFRLRRDESIFGKGSWIRPLLIEITWAIGLPLFFLWQHGGGLIGFDPNVGLTTKGAALYLHLATVWFWLHAILIALMFIATFIDFDERMIPDQVTVSGTLIALVAACLHSGPGLSTSLGLPTTAPTMAGTRTPELINFASPLTPGTWATGTAGLLTCLAIFIVWALALVPKILPPREFGLGFAGSLRLMLASIYRPRRRNACQLRTRNRQMPWITKLYLGMLLLGVVLMPLAWMSWLGPSQKMNLVTAFIGLAVAGGLIWGIRIVGGLALGQEAMGFGDVTLMCMIGAFLGWQVSIAGFVYSILFALVFAIVIFVVTRKSYLAFGPYLCMGSLLALIRWPSVWQEFNHFFWMGPWLLVAFGGSLLLMAVLLPIVRWIKESLLVAG